MVVNEATTTMVTIAMMIAMNLMRSFFSMRFVLTCYLLVAD